MTVRIKVLYGIALACLAQYAIGFALSEPWLLPQWETQGILAVVCFLVGYASAKSLQAFGPWGETARSSYPPAPPPAKSTETAEFGQQTNYSQFAQVDFEAIFLLAPDAILVVGPDGRIMKGNQRARALFGYVEEELCQLSVEDLVPESYRDAHVSLRLAYQRAPKATPVVQNPNMVGLRQDGSTFLAEVSLGPIHLDNTSCVIAIVRDVTEIRRVAKQARQSEQRFRDIFDHAPIGMALATLDGKLTEVNESLCKLLGYSRTELTGSSLQRIAYPHDSDADMMQFEQLLAGKTDVYRAEKRHVHKNGVPVWTLLSVSVQREASGTPLLFLVQFIDIDAIKSAQQALAESETRLYRVLEGSNDGFWDRHIPSGTASFSPRWATMLGYEAEEIAPNLSSWEKLVHPEDLPMCRMLLAEHLFGKRDRYEAAYRMRHKTGHWVWILARGKAYEWDENGNPLRMAGTHTDITVRQVTNEALRLRERTLKAVLEALPIGIWIADASGRINSMNPAALAMGPGVRYRLLTQSGGLTFDDLWEEGEPSVTPHNRALALAIERQQRVSDQLVEIEFADGSKKTVLNSGQPILDEDGNTLGAIAVNQDMTEWLKLEKDLLHRTRQLEESNRELEQFAYVASHDLQEPLRKVSSFAQLFARKFSDLLDDTGRTYIDFMVDGAGRMQILIDDLLLYSRLTRGDRVHSSVDMNDVLRGVLSDLQVAIQEAQATIEVDSLPIVQADAGQMRALVQNLVSNAVKYRALERQPLIQVGASVSNSEATFWIRDNGIGIAPRYFEKIFVIFQRLHARSEYPGTGIGLAICKKIVDNHGGRIWVESTPGQGAIFFFTLPTGEARKS